MWNFSTLGNFFFQETEPQINRLQLCLISWVLFFWNQVINNWFIREELEQRFLPSESFFFFRAFFSVCKDSLFQINEGFIFFLLIHKLLNSNNAAGKKLKVPYFFLHIKSFNTDFQIFGKKIHKIWGRRYKP